MINVVKLIGARRIVVVAVLAALNVGVLCSYLWGLDPMLAETQAQLRAVDGQIAELTSKIGNIKQDMIFMKENVPVYEDLQERGFFSGQDRFALNRKLGDMRAKADLSGFSFAAEEIRPIKNADAEAIDYQLNSSRVNIKINSAVFDSAVYLFLQDLPHALPGHTYVKNFSIKRTGDVNEAVLKQISDGEKIGFFDASVSFDWLTLMPKPAAVQPADGGSDAQGGFRGR